MKVKTLTDKIHESFRLESESEEDDYDAAKIEHFDEYGKEDERSTDFRKRNVQLLSEQSSKYKGKITSRKALNIGKDIEQRTIEEDGSDSDLDSSSLFQFEEQDDTFEKSSDHEDEGGKYDNDDSAESDENEDLNSMDSDEEISNTENEVESNRLGAELKKGASVKNQVQIWERLLEMRIKIQSLLNKSNQLPPPNNDPSYTSSIAKETAEKMCNLLIKLNELKMQLTSQFGELRTHMKRSIDESSELSDCNSGQPPLKRIAVQLENQHNQIRSYRNEVLLKWDERTKLSTPGGLKNKHDDYDIVRKIENVLLNKDALIAKSREMKNEVSAEPQTEDNGEEDTIEKKEKPKTDTYDDSDFYYQQLRELVDYKTSGSSSMAEMSKQIVELQKARQKMKKKVDTRASKGRKIRYVVHKKLVNFMAPDDTTTWTEESKDELFKSLFAT